MNTPIPQHFEPWHLEDTCPTISISQNVENGKRCIIVSNAGAKPSALQRAVDCVNACAGIDNPAEAIQAARLALESLAERWNITPTWHEMDPDDSAWFATIYTDVRHCQKCAQALALLTPAATAPDPH